MKNYRALWVLLFFLSGCTMIDHMTGISEVKQLQKIGTPAQAEIVQIWDTGMTLNHDPVVGMTLRYKIADGSTHTGSTKAPVSRLDIPRIQPGSMVPVRYDPSKPDRVALDMYHYRI